MYSPNPLDLCIEYFPRFKWEIENTVTLKGVIKSDVGRDVTLRVEERELPVPEIVITLTLPIYGDQKTDTPLKIGTAMRISGEHTLENVLQRFSKRMDLYRWHICDFFSGTVPGGLPQKDGATDYKGG